MTSASVDLLEEIRAALDTLEPLLLGRTVDIEMSRLRVLADPMLFRQVFAEGIASALARSAPSDAITVRVARTGKAARIEVTNEGRDVAGDDLNRRAVGRRDLLDDIAHGARGLERSRRVTTSPAWHFARTVAHVTADADHDACRHEVAARGLTPAAVAHRTRDALSRIDLAHLAPVKTLLKRFFSDEAWAAAVGWPALRALPERALVDSDAWIRWKALSGLAAPGIEPSRDAVAPVAQDVHYRVRFEAAGALRGLRS